jgi:hypothetical protein
MQTDNHRLDHFGESLGQAVRRTVPVLHAVIADAVRQLAARNAARRPVEEADDILWDDGEPEERR